MAAPRPWTAQELALLKLAGYKARLRDMAALLSTADAPLDQTQLRRKLVSLGIAPRKRGQACLAPAALRRAWKQLIEQASSVTQALGASTCGQEWPHHETNPVSGGKAKSGDKSVAATGKHSGLATAATGIGMQDFLAWPQNEGRQGVNRCREWTPGDDAELEALAGLIPVHDLPDWERFGGQGRESIEHALRRTPGSILKRAQLLGITDDLHRYAAGRLGRLLGVCGDTVRGWLVSGRIRGWRQGRWLIVQQDDAEYLLCGMGADGKQWTKDDQPGYRWGDTDWEALRRACPLPVKKEYRPREKVA